MKTPNKQFARKILDKEISALRRTAKLINNDFDEACQILSNINGKVITLGMGKSSFVAMKMAATLSSTGTSALFLHPADSLHGDIGVIKKYDTVIIYSNSGETEEIIKLLPLLKILKCSLISITGNIKSTLARHSKVVLDASVEKEACPNNLAPTSSIVCALAISDALALTVAEKNNFSVQDFAKTHPEGALGKRLLITVSDIMTKKNIPLLKVTDKFINLIKKTTKSNLGLAVVVDNKNNIQGVISDGDIKRIMQKNMKFNDLILKDIMTTDPLWITPDSLAAEALNIMEENNVDALPVIEKRKVIGIVTLKEVVKSIN